MIRRYRLSVLRGDKKWLTSNQRLFWRERATRTKQWRQETALLACEVVPSLPRARIVAVVSFSDERRRDPGNWYPTAKACVDGLVDAGVFDDDDHSHVIGPDMRIGPKTTRAAQGIELLIYPTEKL